MCQSLQSHGLRRQQIEQPMIESLFHSSMTSLCIDSWPLKLAAAAADLTVGQQCRQGISRSLNCFCVRVLQSHLFGDEVEAATLKIQAVQRGRQARRRVGAIKVGHEAGWVEGQQVRLCRFASFYINHCLIELVLGG